MHNTRQITNDISWIGAVDRHTALFENVYPIPSGVTYNAYVIKDEKTALLDTIDDSCLFQFFENLEYELDGRTLDYIIVNHMEPDHSAALKAVCEKFPQAEVICSKKAELMINQFFPKNDFKLKTVSEGDSISLGKHELVFVMASMVHWPEAMVTYDKTEKVLFSADAFGSFGAFSGNIFADEVDFDRNWLDDARRYFINIVGKYGVPVMNLLKKAAELEISVICPLHGPVWREDLAYIINKHITWASYKPEDKGVLIVFGSIYGHTENAADILASELSKKGVGKIAVYDSSKTDVSYLVSEAFRYSHVVFMSSSYNLGLFTPMALFMEELKAHSFKNRKVAVVENGSWALSAGKCINSFLREMKNIETVAPQVSFMSSVDDDCLESLKELAANIASDF